MKKRLTTNSVKRNFSTIRSFINLLIQEYGLDCKNAFSRVYLPDLDNSKKRKFIPIETIRQIQQDCKQQDDEARWLVALISDTGIRHDRPNRWWSTAGAGQAYGISYLPEKKREWLRLLG